MQTCVHAHAQFHEHTIRQRPFSLVFQLLAFPARPQKSNQLSLLEAPKCSTLLRCFVPQVWRKGISHSLSTTRGRLLFYPICPAPWGGSLSHEYLVTQATLAIKSWRGFELCLSLKLVTPPHRPILHLCLENHLQTWLIFSTGIKWKLTQTLL